MTFILKRNESVLGNKMLLRNPRWCIYVYE